MIFSFFYILICELLLFFVIISEAIFVKNNRIILNSIAFKKKNLIIITPTYQHATQIPELLRMAITIDNVKKKNINIIWTIIEDNKELSKNITILLKSIRFINYIHSYKKSGYRKKCHKGLYQRNYGLKIIRILSTKKNIYNNTMIYFGDDDNTYHPELFLNIIKTKKKVSIFNVGLIGKKEFEGPKISMDQNNNNNETKIVGWHTSFRNRKYPIDMAGFAFRAIFIMDKNFKFDNNAECWKQEDFLLQKIIKNINKDVELIEIKKVLVWHTKTLSFNK